MMIIESIDKDGFASVSHVRLVEGGIAMETTDCQAKPEQCERERRRTVERLKKQQASKQQASKT